MDKQRRRDACREGMDRGAMNGERVETESQMD